jgi:hypothetical protein
MRYGNVKLTGVSFIAGKLQIDKASIPLFSALQPFEAAVKKGL